MVNELLIQFRESEPDVESHTLNWVIMGLYDHSPQLWHMENDCPLFDHSLNLLNIFNIGRMISHDVILSALPHNTSGMLVSIFLEILQKIPTLAIGDDYP